MHLHCNGGNTCYISLLIFFLQGRPDAYETTQHHSTDSSDFKRNKIVKVKKRSSVRVFNLTSYRPI